MQAEPLFPSIETPRLRLRCLEVSDAQAMSTLMTPAVNRWLASWPSPLPIDDAVGRIAKGRALAAQRRALPLAVIHRSENTFLGYIGMRMSDETTADFGYWLGEGFHGHGYMREAAPAALGLGFAYLRASTIGAGAQLSNTPSIAVMRACGMHFLDERLVHAPVRGRDELCAWYEVTAAEFAAHRTA